MPLHLENDLSLSNKIAPKKPIVDIGNPPVPAVKPAIEAIVSAVVALPSEEELAANDKPLLGEEEKGDS